VRFLLSINPSLRRTGRRCDLGTLVIFLVSLIPSIVFATPSPPPHTTSNPWGELRRSTIGLVAPAAAFAEVHYADCGKWGFENMDWTAVQKLLVDAQVGADNIAALNAPLIRTIDESTNGIILEVPDSVRWSLSPQSRDIIYRVLASGMKNMTHTLPLVIPEPAMLDHLNLNPRLRTGIEKLVFYRGSNHCLIDMDLLATQVEHPDEMRRLSRQIHSYQVLSVELTRDSVLSTPGIADYWTQHEGKFHENLAKLFKNSPGLETIDIAHLLPKFGQFLLNTFPDGETSPLNANCHWLALNFFRSSIESKFMPSMGENYDSTAEAAEDLRLNYDIVNPPYQFGDVLALVAESGEYFELVHTSVYIAEDIVYSKNGMGPKSPFALSTFEAMMMRYTWAAELTIRGYRPRPGSPALPD
jgi:hypothetical protein